MSRLASIVAICAALITLTASWGAEIRLRPIWADGVHSILANEITLESGGQRVFLEIYISDWDLDLDGDPTLRSWQVVIDSSGLASGTTGVIGPAVESCSTDDDCVAAFGRGSRCTAGVGDQCAFGFIDTLRPDYVFACCPVLPSVDVILPDFTYSASLIFPPYAQDPGTPQYAGTLVVDVPLDAAGTFAIGLADGPGETVLRDQDMTPITPLTLAPAGRLHVGAGDTRDAGANMWHGAGGQAAARVGYRVTWTSSPRHRSRRAARGLRCFRMSPRGVETCWSAGFPRLARGLEDDAPAQDLEASAGPLSPNAIHPLDRRSSEQARGSWPLTGVLSPVGHLLRIFELPCHLTLAYTQATSSTA